MMMAAEIEVARTLSGAGGDTTPDAFR